MVVASSLVYYWSGQENYQDDDDSIARVAVLQYGARSRICLARSSPMTQKRAMAVLTPANALVCTDSHIFRLDGINASVNDVQHDEPCGRVARFHALSLPLSAASVESRPR